MKYYYVTSLDVGAGFTFHNDLLQFEDMADVIAMIESTNRSLFSCVELTVAEYTKAMMVRGGSE